MYDADDAFNNPLKWRGGKKMALSIPMLQTLHANTLPFLQLQHHQNKPFGKKIVFKACTSE